MLNYVKEKQQEEVEDDQARIASSPQEIIVEIVAEVISCDVSKTHGDARLITREIKEWHD